MQGITVNDVTFNDGTKTASTIGATDITNMQLGGVTLGFDTQYNYGTFSSPAGFSTSGTDGAVKVRYTAVGNEMFCESHPLLSWPSLFCNIYFDGHFFRFFAASSFGGLGVR